VDPGEFCSATRLLIVAGKGGVGKTTVAAAFARLAARAAKRALVIEVESRAGGGVAALFGRREPLSYEEDLLAPGTPGTPPGVPGTPPGVPGGTPGTPGIRGRVLTPDAALVEYLDDHGMRRIAKRLARTGLVDVVATAAPGIKDILVLGKVKAIQRDAADIDLLVLDAPAAGHAVTFLQSAHGLLDAVRVGPIRAQAQDVVDLLTDQARCQVVLVTLPEETPVNELIDTAYALEDRVGVRLGPVVVNAMYPVLDGLEADPASLSAAGGVELTADQARALAAAAAFRRRRQALQAEQIERLAAALPLPQLHLPYVFSDRIGTKEVDDLARALADEIRRLPDHAGVG